MNEETIQTRSGSNPGFVYTITKYLIVLVILGFVILMVRSQNIGTAPFEDVQLALEPVIDQETMRNVGGKGFRRNYKLNDADYEGVLMYQSVSGMSAEEILLVKAKNRNQINEIKEAIEKRRASRVNDFSGYAPQEAALMENAELIVQGQYVLFLPSSQASELKQAFLASVGE